MVNRILGIVGWVGTALVFAAVAVQYQTVRPEWSPYGRYLAWAGLVCILAYLAGQWREARDFYKTRQARYGTVSMVGILVVLGILVAVNYLGTRQNKRWDLTANQVHSLSEQTVKVLESLDAPAKMTAFFATDARQGPTEDQMRSRLEEYAYHSPNISIEYVDIDRQPARAKQAEVQQYGTTLIEYKGRVERVTGTAEQDLSNALIKATTGESRKVYFTQGHGEKDPTSSDRSGFGTIGQSLTRDNYGVERLVLVQQKEVPADASIVVIAGPRTDFLPGEIDALEAYLAKGGKLMVMLDPPNPGEPETLAGLTTLLREWGVNAGNDIVLDASGMGQLVGAGPETPVAAKYPPHAITDRFEVMTVYPLARSISAVEG
ncbi:MAG: GldG family protein, partial [Acidobacteria bacterium]|nr:GldG family protein [Acidobacteriota bacterium]